MSSKIRDGSLQAAYPMEIQMLIVRKINEVIFYSAVPGYRNRSADFCNNHLKLHYSNTPFRPSGRLTTRSPEHPLPSHRLTRGKPYYYSRLFKFEFLFIFVFNLGWKPNISERNTSGRTEST
ncbi:hypothetical protein B1H10_00825 [candidate division KSB1 bacterium 4484_188]|nr:MAG: hypothetical protein B1H10_00825 [candidate division KSB1 bacterium 4484_188]